MSRSEWPDSTIRMAPGLRTWASRKNMAPSMPGMRIVGHHHVEGLLGDHGQSPPGRPRRKPSPIRPRMSWNMRRRAESTLGSSSTNRMRVFTKRLRHRRPGRRRPCPGCRRARRHDKGGAPAGLGLEINGPAVLGDHDVVGDGQPLARALAHILGGEKGVENLAAIGLGDARAGCRTRPAAGSRRRRRCGW